MTNRGAWFWMNLLHLQQVSVVAHTTHNRLSPDPSPDLTLPPTYITQPQPIITLHYPTPLHLTLSYPISPPPRPSHPTHHPIHNPTKTFHLSSIYLSSIYTQTLTRLIVNNLLTLYISIDILTFMWYNQNNEEGPF